MKTWSEEKFKAFNLAFLRRKTVETMEARKISMISGLYANTNLDEKEGARQEAIQDIETRFAEAVAELYEPTEVEDGPDPIKGNPFFEAMKIPGADLSENQLEAYSKRITGQPWIPTDLSEDLTDF